MKKIALISAVSFLVGILLCSFLLIYSPESKTPQNLTKESTVPPVSSALFASPAQRIKPDLDFVQIAEKVGPAVVKIEAEKIVKRRAQGMWDQIDPFDDFWDRFFGSPRNKEEEFRSSAQGTGFCITPDGYIITNNHIVENAVKVSVITIEGEQYSGKVIGTDPSSDLALIKVNGNNLPYVDLGDSASLKVGEWVLAIGNPFGMEHTVTAGIVSAKGRQLGVGMNVPQYQDFIQTDAAINRGNSGGPLVSLKGEVVGITSNILSPSGGNIGIGFAIPSDLAKKVVSQLKEKGRVIRGYLGIRPRNIDDDLMKNLKLKTKNGAFITEVEKGTPADKAGFERYDVIIEINGQSVKNDNDLRFKIADIEPGTKVNVKVIRKGKEKILTPIVIELESEEEEEPDTPSGKNIGIEVTELTQRLAQRYGLNTGEGLIILKVDRYSEAEKKGIEQGDIIIEVNQNKVTTVKEFESIIKKAKSGETVMLLITRERNRTSLDYIAIIRIP